jgi:GLPGLI family protein
MKKQLITGALLMLAIFSVRAQNPDTAQYMVHYKFSWVRDTGNRANPYIENMALFLGKNSSAYKSYDKQVEDALFKKQVQEQMANSPDGNIRVNRHSEASSQQYYQFPAQEKLSRKEKLFMNSYLINESMPSIPWIVSSDTASFGGLLCQKATAHFKGRDYTCWFCPDMPFHSGPWKFNGLPGVILDAHDAKREVVFAFDGIEKVGAPASPDKQNPPGGLGVIMFGGDDSDGDPTIIQLPSGAIKTTEKEFDKLQDAMRKDPNAFVQSQIAASGMNGDKGPKMKMSVKEGPGPTINNPIELPENK